MSLLVPRHVLVLLIVVLPWCLGKESCYACFGPVMHMYCITGPKWAQHGAKECLGVVHPSFSQKRWIWPKDRQGKKEAGSTIILPAIMTQW
jgi:hypothetical protein